MINLLKHFNGIYPDDVFRSVYHPDNIKTIDLMRPLAAHCFIILRAKYHKPSKRPILQHKISFYTFVDLKVTKSF